jgi:hypothetical protein
VCGNDDDDDDGALRPRHRRERLSLSSSDAASKVLSKVLPGLADVTGSEDDGDRVLPPARVEMQFIVGSA